MSTAFKRGQTLLPSDLNITFTAPNGQRIDPSEITYSIFDYTNMSSEVLVGTPNMIPVRTSVGVWYAPYMVPENSNFGEYRIHWYFRRFPTDPIEEVIERFSVVGSTPLMMGPAVTRGQVLDGDDLYIVFTDSGNTPFDPADVRVEIFNANDNSEKLILSLTPTRTGVGAFYVPWVVPQDATIGDYRVRWTYIDTVGASEQQVAMRFNVVGVNSDGSIIMPQMSTAMADYVKQLRTLLRDNNPDRNYHFRPPRHEDFLNQQTKYFGYVWEDHELAFYLDWSVQWMNSIEPYSGYSLDNAPTVWRPAILVGAAYYALIALSINWIQDEFDYSIGGISLSLDKSGKFKDMAQMFNDHFLEQTTRLKKSTMKFIKGLGHARFGVTVNSALGPALSRTTQTPRNYVLRRM